MKLTVKQKKFIEYYNGNATEAAIKAGYSKKTAFTIGCENLKKPYILEAVNKRQEKEINIGIMSRQDRQLFWTSIAKDVNYDITARLRASELLAKSEADFTSNVNTTIQELPRIIFEIIEK